VSSLDKKSTSQRGKEHEEYIVSIFDWCEVSRRSKSSGASFHDPIDVTNDVLVMECEATENKSYSLKLDYWREIEGKQHSGKLPSLAVRFTEGEKHTDLIVMQAEDVSMLFEELEALRTVALKRD
jgi:hypothetical protein